MLIYETLCDIGAKQVAIAEVEPLLRKLQTFGFHLAAPDIRQNSVFHDKAVSQLLQAAGFTDIDYANWSEEKRIEFLNNELTTSRPFVRTGTDLPAEANHVLFDLLLTLNAIADGLRATG